MNQATTNQNMVDSLDAQPANAGGWPNDTVLLLLGYSKTERYFPAIRQNLDQFWPGRPRTLFVTDGDAVGDDVFVAKDCSFLELLSAAVSDVRTRFPDASNVFLLLEDLCPMAPVDEAKMAHAQDLLRESDGKFLAHLWPRIPNGEPHYGHLDGPKSLKDNDVKLFWLGPEMDYPNSLVAAYWELDHLQDVIAAKLALDLHDPWSFERPLGDQPDSHYMFEGIWPVCKDGFLRSGKLSPKAVTRREFPESALLSQLRLEYCGVDTYRAAALKRFWHKLEHSIRKRVGLQSDTASNPMPTDRRR